MADSEALKVNLLNGWSLVAAGPRRGRNGNVTADLLLQHEGETVAAERTAISSEEARSAFAAKVAGEGRPSAEEIEVAILTLLPAALASFQDGGERRSQADRLVDDALADASELFRDQHGTPHALVGGVPVPLTSRCYGWLRRLMWDKEKCSVGGDVLKTVAGTLWARAEASGATRELHVRFARHDGAVYVELGLGRVIEVTAERWAVCPEPPVLFRRYVNLRPLPDPVGCGSLDDLLALFNLKSERDRRLLIAYLVTLPLADVARPILLLVGPMGAGKTTVARLVKRAWDPTAPESVRLDQRDLLQKAEHCAVLLFDNLSDLPDWAADSLCRMVTGDADSKRRLYTDDEDVIFELRRAIVLNGINIPTDRPDVLDRALPIELERVPSGERRTDEELWRRFEELHPRLLGAALDALSRAIRLKYSVRLSERPRLAGWGEWAAAVYEAMGWGADKFAQDWRGVVGSQTSAAVEASPVALAILRFMADRKGEEFSGSSSELYAELERIAEGLSLTRAKGWPRQSNWMWRRIREVLPLLAERGVVAERTETGPATIITLRRSRDREAPGDAATAATAPENSAHSGGYDGAAHGGNGSTPPRGGDAATDAARRNPRKRAGDGSSGGNGSTGGVYGDSNVFTGEVFV